MTLWATRNDAGDKIDVHVTYGPVVFKVTEDPASVRSFRDNLTALLDAAEKTAAAKGVPL